VILAGGRGERMGGGRNKALLELAGRTVLSYSVAAFRGCCERLLIVAAEADQIEVGALFPDAEVVAGGLTRQGSEWNALQALAELSEDVVAFHDAARPLVSAADVRAVFDAALSDGAAMLALPADLPALEVHGERVSRAYPAGQLWRAQTPQAAHASWLLDAYGRAAVEGFDGTDTAAVLERAGYEVRIVPASAPNPKITVPSDLAAADRLMAGGGMPHARRKLSSGIKPRI